MGLFRAHGTLVRFAHIGPWARVCRFGHIHTGPTHNRATGQRRGCVPRFDPIPCPIHPMPRPIPYSPISPSTPHISPHWLGRSTMSIFGLFSARKPPVASAVSLWHIQWSLFIAYARLRLFIWVEFMFVSLQYFFFFFKPLLKRRQPHCSCYLPFSRQKPPKYAKFSAPQQMRGFFGISRGT